VVELSVSGTVRQVVTVTPANVRLYGAAGTPMHQTVSIVPEKDFPFKILKTAARDGRNIHYRLQEEQNGGRVTYLLTVENRKADQGRYSDRIELTTDSRYKPRIHINVHGRIAAAGPVGKN
jgi:hypothetical protein